jgi:tripartite ATP-independent transporter DctM subunit
MSTTTLSPQSVLVSAPPPRGRRWVRWLSAAENAAISVALGAMMLLPLAEILLRRFFHTSIAGVTAFEQHLTLIVGMLGGAIAAREARLLSLATLDAVLKGRARAIARFFTHSVAAAVSVFLCVASIQFVLPERQAGKVLAYGIPAWVLQLFLPVGFGLVAVRVFLNSSGRWRTRALALLFIGAIAWLGMREPVSSSEMTIPLLVALAVITALGAPLFAVIGGAALILFWGADVPIAAISLDHYRLVTNPTLPTVPLFTLAGYFLAEGGASKRLIRVFLALVGHLRGGPAVLTALVCAFFTSFTGASGVTILALGGLLMPVLLSAKYSERNALGLLTGAGSVGLLLPPCLPLIFYAVIAQVSIEEMFLAGIVPGLLLVGMTAAWGIRVSPRQDETGRRAFDWAEARASIWEAKWELLLPVVAFVGLFSGWATPVEAAAVTALYAFVVETFIYRDLRFSRDATRVMSECGLLVGGVLLILGVALGFTNYLVDAQVPAKAVEWVTAHVDSKWTFLLLLNLFLILVGALMDIYSAIVIVVPLIVPLGAAYGIHPLHLGIVFLANAELGFLMPPVGENLFLASSRFKKPIAEVFRATLPMVVVFLICVALITYIPALTTTLPRWFSR